jgi:hypothetical protein
MLLYLCDRALNHSVTDIHELEVGSHVFGRPPYYDTGADNIVRVHASMLRKRLREYFLTEGRDEPIILDIPRGNYAPVFRLRSELPLPPIEAAPHEPVPPALEPTPLPLPQHPWRIWLPTALAAFFAVLSIFLFLRAPHREAALAAKSDNPFVRQFWSQLFHPNGPPVQIVLDDGAVDFYQEATARTIPLSEYFDRSYLRTVKETSSAARLDPQLIESFILRRESNYGDTAILWKLGQTAGMLKSNADIRFARDLVFSQLKSGNVILLGNRQSNPWIQVFESNLGLRWKFDPGLKVAIPEDESATDAEQAKFRINAEAGKTHEGYTTVSFLPNLNGTGNVMILSGTGGTAVASGLDFLSDERAMADLATRIGLKKGEQFPPFEAMLKIQKGVGLPRTTSIVTCRVLHLGPGYSRPIAQNSSQPTGQR